MADKNPINRASELLKSLSKSKNEAEQEKKQERAGVIREVASDVSTALKPVFNTLLSEIRKNGMDTVDAISKVRVESHTPDVVMPEIAVPKAEVTVRSPKITIPDIQMPDEMNVKGFVQLMGVDLGNPLPVQLRTADGKPLNLDAMSSVVSGGGGGGPRYITVNNTSDNPVPISGSISATFSADTGSGEIGSETLRIVQATNAVSSVNIVSGSSSGTEYADGATANPATGTVAMGDTGEESGNIFALATASGVTGSSVLRVVQAVDSISSVNVVGSVGLTDTELRATSVPVEQVSGSNWSTNVVSTVGLTDTELRTSAIDVAQVSGATWSTNVEFLGGTAIATNDGVSNGGTMRVVHASDVSVSTIATGPAAHDSAVSGNPVLTGLEGRTTNPTKVGNGDMVRMRADTTGRAITRPVQARDLMQTAYATIKNNDSDNATTLLAGASGVFHDLVYVIGANESDAAVSVELRQYASGGTMLTLEIPANATNGVALPVPIPQQEAANSWTVDFAANANIADPDDVTNTTVNVTALFSKEV